MEQIRTRKFAKYEYGDPRGFLVGLRNLEESLGESVDKIGRLRTNALKQEREMRDAALFCIGMSERLGLPIRFAPVEDEDFDFVATCSIEQTLCFCPIQLKEVPPEDLNPTSSIDDVLNSLPKYSNARDLTIAIRLNRAIRFDSALVAVAEDLAIGGLWVFGCISPDQSRWALWGDFMANGTDPLGTVFDYPT